MRFLLVWLIFCFQTVFSQTDSIIYLKEIGLSIKIPSSFNDQLPILKLPGNQLKRLVAVAKGRDAAIWIKMDTSNEVTISNWEKIDSREIDVTFEIVKKSAPYKFDTANFLIQYDGVEFKKRTGKETITRNEFWYFVVLRTFFKSHYLTIQYTFKDKLSSDEIEKMLSTLKFDK